MGKIWFHDLSTKLRMIVGGRHGGRVPSGQTWPVDSPVAFAVDEGDGTSYGGRMSATLETFTTDGRVVISFAESALSPDKREEFLKLLKSEWSARQSRLTKEDATRLAKDLDAGWWSRNRERILGKIGAS
jgi:hypothetical protein